MTEIDTIFPDCGCINFVKSASGKLVIESEKGFDGISPNDYYSKKGLSYGFVIDDEIIKIGESSRAMADRILDYNNGRNNDSTEGRLMDLVYKCRSKVKVYIKYAEGYYMFEGKIRKMNSSVMEQALLQDYRQKYNKYPKLNFNGK